MQQVAAHGGRKSYQIKTWTEENDERGLVFRTPTSLADHQATPILKKLKYHLSNQHLSSIKVQLIMRSAIHRYVSARSAATATPSLSIPIFGSIQKY